VLGSVRLDIGREDLAGLTSQHAVRLVAVSILNALAQDADRPKAPAPPGGPRGRLVNVPLPGLDTVE